MYHQLGFHSPKLLPYTGWCGFNNKYFNLIPILSEANSELTNKALKRLLPTPISLYLNNRVLTVSPMNGCVSYSQYG